ncbi:YfbM family protein [Solwaraspora sp. WMMD1047]|uniref:YfbM family protein n=1 Tax=Solwaraspora sp. WMMD1047 TaxID=3016102 RepID=UPI002415E5A9|nr:YfbM family protein [Solwaraspora sp. WMMD1047]MDG4829052.1 YfbM family protein [Solwaraspora sp. WMMD1047]
MVLIGRRLSHNEWRQILDDPTTVDMLLYGDLDDDQAAMPDPELDLDKSWHAIHYLLTGTAWDTDEGAGAAILGGDEIGEDNGYGPARLLSPENVRTVAAALDTLHLDTLRTRFDPKAMAAADIYPNIWDRTNEVFDTYLASYFVQLRSFYSKAAANDQAVLLA